MKKINTLFTIIALFTIITSPLLAQEEATNGSSLTDKIKERLEKTAEEGIDVIKEELESKLQLPQKKAYIGNVSTISDDLITVKYKDKDYSIKLNDFTEYSKTSLSELEQDDFIIAMGLVYKDSDELSAHKITYIKDPSTTSPRQILSGKIKEIDGNKIAVDGKVLIITSKTNLVIKGVDKPSTEDLELEDNLFSIVTINSSGDILSVKEVLVVPGKNNTASLTPTNADATPSAEATDSAETKE